MAIFYKTIGQWEKQAPFVNAVCDKDVLNGVAGTVKEGKFTQAAEGTYVVMNEEVGDDMNMPEYKIPAGTPLRCLDLSAIDGQTVQIYGAQLPDEFPAKDAKLKFTAEGKLETGEESETRFEVSKIIGNKLGVEATVKVSPGE